MTTSDYVPTHTSVRDGSTVQLVSLVLENEDGERFEDDPAHWAPLTSTTMTFDEFMTNMLNAFPRAVVDEDLDGQLVIYTGLREGPGEVVIPYDDGE